MTTSMLLGWWMLGCSIEWVMDYYIYIGWSTQTCETCVTILTITSQHHIPINIILTYIATVI